LKSPTAIDGDRSDEKEVRVVATDDVGFVMERKATFDVPPAGVGFTTVTEAVAAVAISPAVIAAVRCEPLTKVVVRGLPFQFTTEPEAKPVPSTVRVKAGPPGAMASGTRG
jgi:hypothetical protein